MKRLAVCMMGLLFLVLSGPAWAADSGWHMKSNTVQLTIQPDGDLLVEETIEAFFEVDKRGIIRNIPFRYDVGFHNYEIGIKLLGVTDANGHRYKVKTTRLGNRMRIRVGEVDRFLRGRQVYRIRYRVSRAMLWEEDRAILRWNAIGHEWDVRTLDAQVRIVLPPGVDPALVNHDAWKGPWGAKGQDFAFRVEADGSVVYDLGPLPPHVGATVAVSLPEDAIARPGILSRLGWWLGGNLAYLIWPLATLGFFLVWLFNGRDEGEAGSIAVQYEPPDGLSPGEVGTLLDERADLRDISATIVDLAVRGFLKIEAESGPTVRSKADITFVKRAKESRLKRHEQLLMDALFATGDTVRSDYLDDFHRAMPRVRDALYSSLTSQGYFRMGPSMVRTAFTTFGLLGIALLVALAFGLQFLTLGRVFPGPVFIAGVASVLTLWAFARAMPRRTAQGRKAWEQVVGLEEYIRRAETGNLVRAEGLGVFERLLPYAMVFGVADRWSRAFKELYREPPEWIAGDADLLSSPERLTSLIDDSADAMHSGMFKPPRSSSSSGGWSSGGFSGGGSSGGGFGGGGGSSW